MLELENIIVEIRNQIDVFNNRLVMPEEKIGKLEDKSKENT